MTAAWTFAYLAFVLLSDGTHVIDTRHGWQPSLDACMATADAMRDELGAPRWGCERIMWWGR